MKAKPKNRKRPHVLRVSPEIKGLVQAYATEHGIPTTEAAESLIRGAPDDVARLSADNAEDDVSKILVYRRALVRIMRLWDGWDRLLDGWDPEDDDHAKSVLESIGAALSEAGLAANGTLSESGGRLAERVEAEDEKTESGK